jgi:hypothetical protein
VFYRRMRMENPSMSVTRYRGLTPMGLLVMSAIVMGMFMNWNMTARG